MSLNGRELDQTKKGLQGAGSDLERKYWVALGLYAGLGLLVWFTVGEGTILVWNRPVELRVIPLLVIGSFVLRTVLARQADRIRRDGDKGSDSAPGSL